MPWHHEIQVVQTRVCVAFLPSRKASRRVRWMATAVKTWDKAVCGKPAERVRRKPGVLPAWEQVLSIPVRQADRTRNASVGCQKGAGCQISYSVCRRMVRRRRAACCLFWLTGPMASIPARTQRCKMVPHRHPPHPAHARPVRDLVRSTLDASLLCAPYPFWSHPSWQPT